MLEFVFEAMGTQWSILIDVSKSQSNTFPTDLSQLILEKTNTFERRFSRFIANSEASSFRHAKKGKYPISAHFHELLLNAQQLKKLTKGSFDPAVGGLMEAVGYDPAYHLMADDQKVNDWKLPEWSVSEQSHQLEVSGPIIFDLGGTGKGYWIDQLSALLYQHHFSHHLVEGGGDMIATTKADGSGWQIALEWPGHPDYVAGTVVLKNQGLAVSDIFKRSWGKWHHLLNPRTKKPQQQFEGCVVVATSAWLADQLTSVISLSEWENHLPSPQILSSIDKTASYLLFLQNNQVHAAANWIGQLFTE